ncbi:MAG TPA: zf-HC2 domain-containing protein [Thermoanaerobaculia bacterium]|nr:zf-HC2 domain-containing protein [Thermoanaerobaculia bacterium]
MTPSTPEPCRLTTLALPWLLNGSLAPAERCEVREHLIHCPSCRAELERTRETLVVFRAAAAATEQPRVAAAGATRIASRGRVLRPLAWAAMVAAILGSAWLARTWVAGPTPMRSAERQRQAPPSAPAVTTPVRMASVAPLASPPPSAAPVSASRPSASAARPRRRADSHTAAPTRPEVISVASFENGTVASTNGEVEVAPASSKISTVDFENGELAGSQIHAIPGRIQ